MKKTCMFILACCISLSSFAQDTTNRKQIQKEVNQALSEAHALMNEKMREIRQTTAELRQSHRELFTNHSAELAARIAEAFEGWQDIDWANISHELSTNSVVVSGGVAFRTSKSSASVETTKEARKVGSFSRLDISSSFAVELKKGAKHELVVECQEKYLPYIKSEVRDGELNLYIDTKGLPKLRNIEGPLRAYITMPELQSVELSGACRLTTEDAFTSNKFSVDLSGASSLKGLKVQAQEGMIETSGASSVQMDVQFDRATIDLSGVSSSIIAGNIKQLRVELSGASKLDYSGQSDEVSCDLSGTSRLIVKGSASKMRIESSGASSIDAAGYKVQTAKVAASGGSRISIFATESISPTLSGASKLSVVGQPQITNRSLSSGASIHYVNQTK